MIALTSLNNWILEKIQTVLSRMKNRVVTKGFFYNWKKLFFWFSLIVFGLFVDSLLVGLVTIFHSSYLITKR